MQSMENKEFVSFRNMGLYGIYVLIITLFWVFTVVYLVQGRRRIHFLSKVKNAEISFPAVVIIVPVRNEGENLREAMTSLLDLRYPSALSVIALNDRSTDNTQIILHELAKRHATLTVIEIDELPSGWLGKNHALYKGYQSSTAEWILFTDADVHFESNTLTKAMSYVIDHSLDHLTVMPGITSQASLLNALLGTFVMMLELKHKPWLVRDPKSKVSLGVGAVNLVKRSA